MISSATSNDFWLSPWVKYTLDNKDGYADIIATKKFLDLLNEDPDDVRLGVFLAPTTKDFKKLYGTNTVFLNKYPADGLSDFKKHLVRKNSTYFTPCTHIFFILPKFIRRIFNDIFSNIQWFLIITLS